MDKITIVKNGQIIMDKITKNGQKWEKLPKMDKITIYEHCYIWAAPEPHCHIWANCHIRAMPSIALYGLRQNRTAIYGQITI
jgi:hypothetical protein